MRILWALLLVPLLSLPAQAQVDLPIVTRSITLPLELKDPHTAYGIGMIPFGAQAAATYVGTTRFSWDAPAELRDTATRQTLADLGLTVLGAGLIALGNGDTGNRQVALYTAGGLSLLSVPLSHAWFYAPFWGREAIEFNRRQIREAGFPQN